MPIKVGVVQDSPVFFDRDKTIAKIEELLDRYASLECDLLVFPESFIPGYPRGFSFGATVGNRTEEGRRLYGAYHKNSVELRSKEVRKLEELSKKHKAYLVMGVTEKKDLNGSLYCSMLYISPLKGLLGVHRKIKPTGSERIIWDEAAGEDLVTFKTAVGKIGGLICWENYMPLARMAMYRQGVEIYIAPTADARESWIPTMRHIALEGRCFVLGCNEYYSEAMLPAQYKDLLEDTSAVNCPGGSVIVSPRGEILAGPLWGEAGILTATLDLDEVTASKLDFDVNGHYGRNDIFHLSVLGQPPLKDEKSIK
ncbi:nitrilase [Muriicola jejuensis]|uniref:Nitrilase n=1 Tax=Muriicola jejuensis TaxID=504488 RepID=A0A6P0UCM3_9FLAO|nr:carbon-nitrogen hydrolase family protein [Muriicola jejuensis]NER09649.1 nitrilase [Muriicola jejuensis]SMP06984.1 nitrilase [Muriicola jejuensis]